MRNKHRGQIYFFAATLLMGSTIAGLLVFSGASKAQTAATQAPSTHTSCLPVKDYPNSNGYTESYTRPNVCHSARVLFTGTASGVLRDSDNWRKRCPQGSTLYVHGNAHYSMSPSMDGRYDGGAGGGAHYYCVNSSGTQVEPIPGESETNPFHTHASDGLAKVQYVDTGVEYVYSFFTGQWVSCPGGIQGPFPQDQSWVDTQNGHFPNHFHCKNPYYTAGSSTVNTEAIPMPLTPAPQSTIVGSFSTSDMGTKDQFVDKGPWGTSAPLGTVACYHSNSDKVYFSTTGACPAVTLFPLKPAYTFDLTKLSGSVGVAANAGATASIKFKLKNTNTIDTEFPIYCDSGYGSFMGHMYYLNADGSLGAKFNSYSGTTSLPSGNVVLTPGAEKSFEFKFDIPAGTMSVGGWTMKCHTYPLENSTRTSLTDKKKEITETLSVSMPTVTVPPDSTVTLTQLFPGQYNNVKFSIKVADPDGVKDFSVRTASGASLYGGSPGASYNVGACGGANMYRSLDSSTVDILTTDFPLQASVTDCRTGAAAYSFSVPAPTSTTPPPAIAPIMPSGLVATVATNGADVNLQWADNSNNETGFRVWRRLTTETNWTLDGSTPPNITTYIDSYISPGTYEYKITAFVLSGATALESSPSNLYTVTTRAGTTNANWVNHVWTFTDGTEKSFILNRTDKQYTDFIASVDSACKLIPKNKFTWRPGAGDDSATNWANFGIPDCGGTGITPPPPGPDTTARACKAGEASCPKGSWCDGGGLQCHLPDSRLTCVPWPTIGTSSPMTVPPAMMNPAKCPSGTSPCNPSDGTRCIAPGQKGKYFPSGTSGSGNNPWCGGGSMQQYANTKNADSSYDMLCLYHDETPPSGFSACRPDEKNCKTKGDKWTEAEEKAAGNVGMFYCTNGMRCSLSGGGGTCVGYSEQCPSNTLYCPQNTYLPTAYSPTTWVSKCGEPETYTDIDDKTASGFWCGGGGMAFYSKTKAYCPAKKVGSGPGTGMMWTAVDIKSVLDTLGSGWKLCNPYAHTGSATAMSPLYSSKCLEPGQKGSSNDWCAWYPPNAYMPPIMNETATRTCPSLDGGDVTPPPPPPGDDHAGCDMKMYYKKNGLFIDEKGVPGIIPASKPGHITDYKFFTDHYHLCDTPEPPMCGQAVTRAFNPKTGECRNFPTTCIDDGWVEKDCVLTRPGPEEYRECRPGEVSSGVNMCVIPSYRWLISEKKWEKCPFNKPMPYEIMGAVASSMPNAKYTSCQSMRIEIDEAWMTARYLTRPPEKYGEWYMPPWDASSEMKQYNPKTDRFEECRKDFPMPIASYTRLPIEWYSPCTPVPSEDEKWLLGKFRAEYKIHQLYSQVNPVPPGPQPPGPVPPGPPEPPMPLPPDVPVGQCKSFLAGIRQSLNGDKQFWLDVKRQIVVLPKDHADYAKISSLLEESKEIIRKVEQVVRKGKCDKETLTSHIALMHTLHQELFAELSSYLSTLRDVAEVAQCRSSLSDWINKLSDLSEETDDKKARAELDTFAAEIEAKLKEFDGKMEDFEFDVGFECREYVKETESAFASITRENDREVARVVEEVLERELAPFLEKLTKQSEEKKEQLDKLLVNIAELQKAVEKVTAEASTLSQQIATSYKAIAAIDEKFATEKAHIEEAKARLIPLVQEATSVLESANCLKPAMEKRFVEEFGTVGSLNLIGDQDDILEKRLRAFIAACKAREVTKADIDTFFKSVSDVEAGNLRESFRRGLTPFEDVPTHEWYYPGMVNAHNTGVMTQGRPGENALAQDALLMVLKASGATDVTGDCELKAPAVKQVSPYAECAVNYAHSKGLPLQSNMQEPISRIRIAEWITLLNGNLPARADSNLELFNSFMDIKDLGASQRFVAYLSANGVMVGDSPDGTRRYFHPNDSLTRAALAALLQKLGEARGDLPN